MNKLKQINFLVLSWAIEALNQDIDEDTDSESNDSEPSIDFAVGGQAVIEGVMMRSPSSTTIAVRKEDGSIVVRKKPYRTVTQRFPWLNQPILRGVINLFEMMIIGTDAINFSANESLEEEEDLKKKKAKLSAKVKEKVKEKGAKMAAKESTNEDEVEKSKTAKFFEVLMFGLSFVLAMALSLSLFKFLPYWITTFLEKHFSVIADNYVVFNLIDGLIKMSIFLSYIFILSLIPSFRRIFEYHGAEHKSIFNYESKLPLNVKNADKQIRFHPRCGTSFILIVFVISIIFYTFVPKLDSFWTSLALRIAVLPFIAGISYEVLKMSAKHKDHLIVKAMIAPGLWFQRLTTKEPDASQLEIGLRSLSEALAMEKIHGAKISAKDKACCPGM